MAKKIQPSNLEPIGVIARREIDELKYKQAHPELFRPIPTGLTDLDKIISGITESTFTVVGGSAKAGKSTMLLHLGTAIAASGRGKTLFYSLEEIRGQIGQRSLSRLSMKTSRTMMRELTMTDTNFVDLEIHQRELEKIDLLVDDGITEAEQIINYAIQEKAKFVVCDYLQLMTDRMGNDDGWERWDAISRKFVNARNQHKIAFIISYQIGDSGKAYGTRSIYRDADLILEVSQAKDELMQRELQSELLIKVKPSRVCLGGKCTVYINGAYNRLSDIPTDSGMFE